MLESKESDFDFKDSGSDIEPHGFLSTFIYVPSRQRTVTA